MHIQRGIVISIIGFLRKFAHSLISQLHSAPKCRCISELISQNQARGRYRWVFRFFSSCCVAKYILIIIVKRIAKVKIYFECVCFGEFKFEEELAMPFVPKCFCFGCWDWEWIVESLPREILIYPVHSIWRLSSPILIVVVVVISGGGDCGTNCPCTVYGGHSCSRAGRISGQWQTTDQERFPQWAM